MGFTDTLRRLAGEIDPRQAIVGLMPTAVRQSFLAKLLVTVSVTVLIGSAIGGVFYVGISSTLDQQVERNVRATTELQTTVYNNWFRNRREQLSTTVQQSYITDTDSDHISAELTIAAARSDVISEYHLVSGESGRIVGSSASGAVGRTLYNVTSVGPSLLRNSSWFLLPSRYRTFGDEPVLLFRAQPSYTDRILIAEVEIGHLPDLPHTFEGSTTYVVARNGSVLVGPSSLSFTPASTPQSPTITRADGSLYTYQQIPETRHLLVMETPVDSAFAVKQAVLLSFALTLVLLFGVITVVGLSSGEAVIRDLTRLASKSRAMAAGKLDVDLSNDREDEIGVLYTSFREMRDALRERIREAEAARETAQEARAELADRKADIEEQRAIISVLNRVLRHNLRNDLTVVWSHLDFVRDRTTDSSTAEHLDVIERKLDELVERADKAREIEQLTREGSRSLVTVDIGVVIDSELERFRELYPEATIEFDAGDTTTVRAHEAVEFVVANLVENAIEHNDNPEPSVRISVSSDHGETVTVEIADDGPGIPETELESLEQGYETAVRHGSGLGLWLVNWLVDEMDGELRFDDRDPTGTVVTLRFQAAEGTTATTQATELDHD